MQVLPSLRVKPQGMSQLRFNKILRLAKAGEICAVFDHIFKDVPRLNITYTAQCNDAIPALYRPEPPKSQRKCVMCGKTQEYRPADWVDA